MKRKTIKKSIELDAPKETVWDVLLNDKFTRIWYGEFSEGSHAETDWKLGSKAVFVDNTKKGLVGTVIANKPYEVLSVEYNGWMDNGIEDYDSETAKEIKGSHETYHLTEKNGKTKLSIECDMGEDMYDFMSEAWDRALQKLKHLAESQKQPQS